jgi:hypothetical protein
MHGDPYPRSTVPRVDGSRSIIFELLGSFGYVDDCSGGPDVNGILHHFFRDALEATTFYTSTSPNQRLTSRLGNSKAGPT